MSEKKICLIAILLASMTLFSGCRKNEDNLFAILGDKSEETINSVSDSGKEIIYSESEEAADTSDDKVSEETTIYEVSTDDEIMIGSTEETEISEPDITETSIASGEKTNVPIIMTVNIYNVNDQVSILEDTDGYQTTDITSKIMNRFSAGTMCNRIAISSNGFSLIEGSDGLYSYVLTDKVAVQNSNYSDIEDEFMDEVTILETNDTVTVIVDDAILYSNCDYNSDALATVAYGTVCMRTGICSNGWTRISTNVGDLYLAPDSIME